MLDDDLNEVEQGGGDLREPLVPKPRSFVKEELLAIWTLSLPMMTSFFCRMAMASTDSAFVGHLTVGSNTGGTYLAASTLSNMVLGVLIAPALAFNRVLNALVGQAVGSGNRKIAGVWLQQSMFFLTLTMLLCMPAAFYVEQILALLGFEDNLCHLAGTFALWNIFWFIPNGYYQCLRFYFQALGYPNPAMYNNIVFVFINALLNWIFVFGGPFSWDGLGFIGAAVSLSLSRCLQPLTYWIYMVKIKKYHTDAWPGWDMSQHTRARTHEFLVQSLPRVGTTLFQSIIGQASTMLISQLGSDAVSASTAVSTVTMVHSGALVASSSAATGIRVGFHLGKGAPKDAKRSAYLNMQLLFAALLVFALCCLPFRSQLLDLATNDPVTHRDAVAILIPVLFSLQFSSLVQVCTAGVFGGQGRTKLMAILSFTVEMPLTIGGLAVGVLLLKWTLAFCYWYIGLVSLAQLLLCMILVQRSKWEELSETAIARSGESS